MQGKYGLLQVVDGSERACTANTSTAVQNYFVISWNISQVLGVEKIFTATLTPVMDTKVLNYRLDDLVVFNFGSAEIRPCQVLKLSHNTATSYDTICIFLCELKSSLDQVRHQSFFRDTDHLFIVFELNTLNTFVLRPVLMTFDLRVFF